MSHIFSRTCDKLAILGGGQNTAWLPWRKGREHETPAPIRSSGGKHDLRSHARTHWDPAYWEALDSTVPKGEGQTLRKLFDQELCPAFKTNDLDRAVNLLHGWGLILWDTSLTFPPYADVISRKTMVQAVRWYLWREIYSQAGKPAPPLTLACEPLSRDLEEALRSANGASEGWSPEKFREWWRGVVSDAPSPKRS